MGQAADQQNDQHADEVGKLANALGFLTSRQLAALGGGSEETLRTKRKRGEGPRYVQWLNEPLYPIDDTRAYLGGLVRDIGAGHPKAKDIL